VKLTVSLHSYICHLCKILIPFYDVLQNFVVVAIRHRKATITLVYTPDPSYSCTIPKQEALLRRASLIGRNAQTILGLMYRLHIATHFRGRQSRAKSHILLLFHGPRGSGWSFDVSHIYVLPSKVQTDMYYVCGGAWRGRVYEDLMICSQLQFYFWCLFGRLPRSTVFARLYILLGSSTPTAWSTAAAQQHATPARNAA
jgi:hypothetical protein